MIDKTCETCGTAFQVKAARRDTARFCSNRCRGLGMKDALPQLQPKRVAKTCEICGEAFAVKAYRAESARFCSGSCRGTWVGGLAHNRQPKAYMLGNKLREGLPPSNAGKPGPSGEANPNWKPPINLTCEHCGQSFQRKPWEVRRKSGTRFCSRLCFEASACFLAERSSTYLGGPTTVRGPNWRSIRAAVVGER